MMKKMGRILAALCCLLGLTFPHGTESGCVRSWNHHWYGSADAERRRDGYGDPGLF